ncbi:MAG: hypothetical protein OXN16_06795 [Gammaproteobacteria bacterium]|nr:hypothetical protein [Gammaproteobacteria bacterium]
MKRAYGAFGKLDGFSPGHSGMFDVKINKIGFECGEDRNHIATNRHRIRGIEKSQLTGL